MTAGKVRGHVSVENGKEEENKDQRRRNEIMFPHDLKSLWRKKSGSERGG